MFDRRLTYDIYSVIKSNTHTQNDNYAMLTKKTPHTLSDIGSISTKAALFYKATNI